MSTKRPRPSSEDEPEPHALYLLQHPPAPFFPLKPIPDLTKTVCDFICAMIDSYQGRGQIEIEGKLGLIVEKGTDKRLYLPVLSQTPLNDMSSITFESNLTEAQHKSFNQIFNALVETEKRVKYTHTKQTDRFYPQPQSHRRERTRVTTDDKTKAVVACITKTNLGHLDIYCPNSKNDIRISVSAEEKKEMPSDQMPPDMERKKDRISYADSFFQIDLTQTSTSDPRISDVVPSVKTHELEVEVSKIELLLRERTRLLQKVENQFVGIIQVFLNNLTVINNKSV